MNIYVGTLSYNTTEKDLRGAFESFGTVTSITLSRDGFNRLSEGYGFVEMPSAAEAQTAMTNLDGEELNGQTMTVHTASPGHEGEPYFEYL